ncbi:MAG: SET domain-containing protein-lysine N-methyltransferase [Actinomycetia bacterium]|nr:SET domain-containing protein-lysine N-methyltransferase [Actinomycetes bacterium]
MSNGYLTAKAAPKAGASTGPGCFAVEPILAGHVVAAFGGRCLTREEFDLLPVHQQVRSIQIDENLFLSGATDPEPSDFINHSCEPNCGMSGNTVVVALRDIQVGEQLTYDYAMSNGSDYDEFECACGAAACRGKVTGHDWMLPEVQLRYRGNFSPYLAARIASLASAGAGAERRAFAY